MPKQYVYCYWGDVSKVIDDFANSPIFSMATLRAHTPDPIWVIDYSNTDWEGYAEALDVQVIKRPVLFRAENYPDFNGFQLHALSRTFDIIESFHRSNIDECVFVDADMFWLGSVGDDLEGTLFNSHPGNNGCYYVNKLSNKAMKYLDMCLYYSVKGLTCAETRERIKSLSGYFNDEAVFIYVRKIHPELCSSKFFPYNGPIDCLLRAKSIVDYKNVHLISSFIPKSIKSHRCLFPLAIKEMEWMFDRVLPEVLHLRGQQTIPLNEALTDLTLAFKNYELRGLL